MKARLHEGSHAQQYSRRTALRVALSATAVAAGSALLAACGDTTGPTTTPVPATKAPTTAPTTTPPAMPTAMPTVAPPVTSAAPANASPTSAPMAVGATSAMPAPTTSATSGTAMAVDGKLPASMPGVPDAYTKLPKPFKAINAVPGRGGKVTTFQIQYANPIPPRDQNRYWQELEKRLGATLEVSFASGSGGYQEKLPALIAGGDSPDLTFVWLDGAPAASKPVAQGAFLDLGPYLTGNALKDYPNLAAFPSDIWQRAAFNKKIYGVPRPRLRPIGTMTYRQDWADKVGVSKPANAADMMKVLTAFSKNDPDGNGKADTWGMGNQNNAAAALFGTRFFFFMFRVPNDWRLNKDGTLTYHIETDEYRQAVSYMRQLWDAGVYHPDTLTMTASQVNEYFVGGKIGGYWQGIEGIPGSSGRRGQTKALNANANVIGLVPPGFDGGKPAVWNFQGYYGFTSIPAKVKDPERVKELLHILDYYAAPFGSEEWIFLNYGIEGIHHDVKPDGTRVKNDLGQKEIGELNNLTYCLPPFYYDTPGDAQYMQQLVTDLSASAIESPILGYYSPTSVEKGGELNQLYIDREVALITGRDPLSSIDQYIKDWRARGGDQMRKEYEDALRAP